MFFNIEDVAFVCIEPNFPDTWSNDLLVSNVAMIAWDPQSNFR